MPGLRSIDPYDLIVVLAGEGTLPGFSDDEKVAHQGPQSRVRRHSRGAALPGRAGPVHLYPGSEPERLLDRSNDMFFPVTGGVVMLNDRRIGDGQTDTILVNRHYLRRVEQIDGDAAADGART